MANPTKPRKLSPALEKIDRAAKAAKASRLADLGFKAIADIKALRTKIADDYLAMGRGLVTLKDPKVMGAIGYTSFEALCEEKLGMAVTRADVLIELFQRLDGELVRQIGVDRASAIMNLADATPDDDDVAGLLTAKVKLPGGGVLDVAKAPIKAIVDAATAFRRASAPSGKKVRRGLTVDANEQRRFDAELKRLRGIVGDDHQAKLIATHKDTGADAQVRMPLTALTKLLNLAVKGLKA